jgi:hypothetical protein
MTMPYPNYHHCEGCSSAEKQYGEGAIHIDHDGTGWRMNVVDWGSITRVPIKYCPFCGKELPK